MKDLYDEIEEMNIRHYPTVSIIKMLNYCAEHPRSQTSRLDRSCGYGTERLMLSLLKKLEQIGVVTKRRTVIGYLWTVTESGKDRINKIRPF